MTYNFNSSVLESVHGIMAEAEAAGKQGLSPALGVLRRYCLTDFCELLLSLPKNEVPELSRLLPRMPPAAVQAVWANSSGHDLLQDTIAFAHILERHFQKLAGRPFQDARVLDFGCGFGRLMRAMLYFVDPDRLFGVDPWPRSIAECKRFNVLGQLSLSDYVPTQLPVSGEFDLCFAYSVYTHLSERVARATLDAVRQVMRTDGLFVITVRPIEFWAHWGMKRCLSPEDIQQLELQHRHKGHAFLGLDTEIDGELTYGTASIAPEWLEATGGWQVVGYDRGLDYWQQVFLLKPL